MDLFFSCDIEGVSGAAAWGQLAPGTPELQALCGQMTREVAAACRAAVRAGGERILVKDAHDTGRNIALEELPVQVQVNRGWAGDPYGMMSGIQHGSWDGAVFLGYHSGAGTSGSPMAHTMEPQKVDYIEINGERASEFTLNAYMAGLHGVPVCFVSGDAALCDAARRMVPGIAAVPVVGRAAAPQACTPPLRPSALKKPCMTSWIPSGIKRALCPCRCSLRCLCVTAATSWPITPAFTPAQACAKSRPCALRVKIMRTPCAFSILCCNHVQKAGAPRPFAFCTAF